MASRVMSTEARAPSGVSCAHIQEPLRMLFGAAMPVHQHYQFRPLFSNLGNKIVHQSFPAQSNQVIYSYPVGDLTSPCFL